MLVSRIRSSYGTGYQQLSVAGPSAVAWQHPFHYDAGNAAFMELSNYGHNLAWFFQLTFLGWAVLDIWPKPEGRTIFIQFWNVALAFWVLDFVVLLSAASIAVAIFALVRFLLRGLASL
ncbi:hypothetical protein BKA65DRAFT_500639 [Rhexocercosporidium sp. MPI-PUGE-AT-0058]|nr:hypothetical protein BKA65DRAFT_500639 [Rhexocercosporidium sp. MPI-PUGE-AT-0058]